MITVYLAGKLMTIGITHIDGFVHLKSEEANPGIGYTRDELYLCFLYYYCITYSWLLILHLLNFSEGI